MAAARRALGGDERLSAVKSFSLTGRTQQARGKNSVPNELEMRCERPDRCTRTDEIPERGVRQDFGRLTLGMFAGSFSSAPLTFSYVGQDEMPQGKADVIDARGPDNFVVRLFIDSTSRLPIMVSWVPHAAPAPKRSRVDRRLVRQAGPQRPKRRGPPPRRHRRRARHPPRPSSRASTTRTIARWTACGCPSACAAPPAARPWRKRSSIGIGSIRRNETAGSRVRGSRVR